MQLRAIKTGDDTVVTDPKAVMEAITKYYTPKMMPAAGAGSKTGLYHPSEQARSYPWLSPNSPDRFDLATAVSSGAAPRRWLHNELMDQQAFQACLKSLAHGKAPGPDQITNEMLNMLPPQGQELLHGYIQLMWATGYTPNSWKESTTVLLYKNKGTPLKLQFYRRIGLELTIYKLWTRMITWALADYAERHNILSYTQGGFRNKRTCMDQLELFTMLLEDAKLTSKDIYLLMVDFSEAFDTIDHDKLLQIMYDLGFPTDATEVVKNLYTGATTAFVTPFGKTSPIAMDRGTIQGDSLSPFLFILYLEPLLRWLRVGARGYIPGAYKSRDILSQLKQQIPDVTYADDLNLITSSTTDMMTQADKVTLYADWGHLTINSTKTLLTGARHCTDPQDPYNVQKLQRALAQVKVQRAPASFHDPRKPFRYLGVQFTINLDWSKQYQLTRDTIREMCRNMKHSYATTSQKMRTLSSCIRTKIRYAFCVAPYTKAQLKALDGPLCRAAKEAYGLPCSTATAVAHEDVNKGGLGCPSLLVEYNTVQIQRLTESLNDPGPLGELSRTRLQTDGSCLDKLTAAARPALAYHSMRLRQLLACASVDVELTKQGRPPLDLPDTNPILKDLQTLQAIAIPQPPDLLLADLHQLRLAGLQKLQNLMSATGRTVLTARQFAMQMGKRPKARTVTAFKRVAHMLSVPPGITKETYSSRPPPQAGHGLTVHPEYARLLKLHHLIDDIDLRAAPLPTLWAAQTHAPCTQQAMTELQAYIASLVNSRPKGQAKHSSVRQTLVDITTPLVYQRRVQTGYAVYRRLKDEKKKVFRDMIEQLYNNYAAETDLIEGIEGFAVAARHVGKGKRRKTVTTQNQVIVRWAPTVMQGWMVELAKQKGYQVEDTADHAPKLLTHEEVCNIPNLPIECCCPNAHLPTQNNPANTTLAHCNVCSRRYHVECLHRDNKPNIGLPGQDITAGWTCDECEWRGYATAGLPPQLGHYKVHWKPSRESENDLLAHNPAIANMIATFRQHQAAAAAVPQPPMAPPPSELVQAQQRLSALQQQGDYYPDHPQRYNINIGQQYSNMFDMDTSAMNPHADIHPTGQHEVFIREVEMCIEGQRWNKTLACIYTPDGRCRYTLTPERTAILYKQYCHSSRYKPKMMVKLRAGSFPEELYALMCRYKDGAQIRERNCTRTVKIKNHWATPPEVYEALQQLTGITKERFASPLNYNPTFGMYWSAHKKDQIFGAKWDTYRYKWTGGSVHNPKYEDEDLNRNIATAIAAARSSSAPVFGIHILPAWSDANRTAYLSWLQHFPDNCKHLLQIPRKHFRFQKPTTWEQGEMYAGHPRWDVNVIVTGNARGFDAHLPYWDKEYMTIFWERLQTAINASLPDDKEIQDLSVYTPQSKATTTATPNTLTSKQLARMGYPKQNKPLESLLDDSPTPHDPPALIDASTTLEDLEQQLPQSMLVPPPLRHNWKEFVYTDGSYKPTGRSTSPADAACDAPGIGAGVYFPPQAADEDDDRAIPVIPLGECQPQNTINRAELVGILTALKHGANRIATDSLTSMYQIKKMLRRPQDLTNHQHCQLIKEIAGHIMTAEQKTTLHKVKGHSSIIGNEKADEVAKAAATGETPYEECEKYDTPSNDRDAQYWPYEIKWQNHWERLQGQRRLIDRVKRLRPMADLQDSVRKHCHHTSRFGLSNRNTCYFEAFKKIEGSLDLAASNAFMAPGKVTYAERKTALRYRYGTLWTRKMAYRCGHAPSSKCLLCGDEDGGHHTASGCPALKAMYINRHNKVGRLIMTRVLRGRKGAFVLQMDLGSAEKCAEDGIATHQPRTIPWEALPPGMKEAVQHAAGTTSQRPDGLLYKPKQGTTPAEYWIIEIKICRDSDPQGQQSKADYQHQVLIEQIKKLDPNAKVWYYPMLVGASGTMYLNTTMYMQALGIKGNALKQCIFDVHIAAVKSLHSIYTTKRKLEKPKEPVWHRRNYKKVS
jgi:ribonuclease HI